MPTVTPEHVTQEQHRTTTSSMTPEQCKTATLEQTPAVTPEQCKTTTPTPSPDSNDSLSEESKYEGSETEESESEESSRIKDPDYKHYEPRLLANMHRLQRGRDRAAKQAPHLFPASPKKMKQTSKELDAGCHTTDTERMAERTNCNDLLFACMLLLRKNLSPWQSEMSVFFLAGDVLGIHPCDLVLGRSNPDKTTLPTENLLDSNWNLPRLPNICDVLKGLFKTAYSLVEATWKVKKERICDQHKHHQQDVVASTVDDATATITIEGIAATTVEDAIGKVTNVTGVAGDAKT